MATNGWRNRAFSAFGVGNDVPGIPRVSNKEVHNICGALGFYAIMKYDQFTSVNWSRRI